MDTVTDKTSQRKWKAKRTPEESSAKKAYERENQKSDLVGDSEVVTVMKLWR